MGDAKLAKASLHNAPSFTRAVSGISANRHEIDIVRADGRAYREGLATLPDCAWRKVHRVGPLAGSLDPLLLDLGHLGFHFVNYRSGRKTF